jgi:hypothetical protein
MNQLINQLRISAATGDFANNNNVIDDSNDDDDDDNNNYNNYNNNYEFFEVCADNFVMQDMYIQLNVSRNLTQSSATISLVLT